MANYVCGTKSASNSNPFWLRRLFNVCVRVFCAPNATILLVYIPAKIKMSFIWKDVFFLPKSASFVSRSQAIFPSVVQPYLIGGRIKLIICKIRHELVEKKVRWRTLYKLNQAAENSEKNNKVVWKFFFFAQHGSIQL